MNRSAHYQQQFNGHQPPSQPIKQPSTPAASAASKTSSSFHFPSNVKQIYLPNQLQSPDFVQFATTCVSLFHNLLHLRETNNQYRQCLHILATPTSTPDYVEYATKNQFRFLAARQLHLSNIQKHIHIGMNPFLYRLYQDRSPLYVHGNEYDNFSIEPSDTTYNSVLSSSSNMSPGSSTPMSDITLSSKLTQTLIPNTSTNPFHRVFQGRNTRHELIGLVNTTTSTTRYIVNKPTNESFVLSYQENETIQSGTNISLQSNVMLFPTQTQSIALNTNEIIQSTPLAIQQSIQNVQDDPSTINTPKQPIIRRKIKFALPVPQQKSSIALFKEANPHIFALSQLPTTLTQQPTEKVRVSTRGKNKNIPLDEVSPPFLPQLLSDSSKIRIATIDLINSKNNPVFPSAALANPENMRNVDSTSVQHAVVVISDLLQNFPEYSKHIDQQSSLLHQMVKNLTDNAAVTQQERYIALNRQSQPHIQHQQLPPHHQLIPSSSLTLKSTQIEFANMLTQITTCQDLSSFSPYTSQTIQLPISPHFQLLLYTLIQLVTNQFKATSLNSHSFSQTTPLAQAVPRKFSALYYPFQTHYQSTLDKFLNTLSYQSYHDPASQMAAYGQVHGSSSISSYAAHHFYGLSAREVVQYFTTLPKLYDQYFQFYYEQLFLPQHTTQLHQLQKQGQHEEIKKIKIHLRHLTEQHIHESTNIFYLQFAQVFSSFTNACRTYQYQSISQQISVYLRHLKTLSPQFPHLLQSSAHTTHSSPLSSSSLSLSSSLSSSTYLFITDQLDYFSHLQYLYQRLICTFVNALQMASILYQTIQTSTDIFLLTKVQTFQLPITSSYQQSILPYLTILSLIQPDNTITGLSLFQFSQIVQTIFNLPIEFYTFTQLNNILSTASSTGSSSNIILSSGQCIIPLFYSCHNPHPNAGVLCLSFPFSPLGLSLSAPNGYVLPCIDIIGLNIIVPTTYQLFIPLSYNPVFLQSTFQISPTSTITSSSTLTQPFTQIQQYLPAIESLPLYQTICSTSLPFYSSIDLSLRVSILSPSIQSASLLSLLPHLPYLRFFTNVFKTPLILPYTTNLVKFLTTIIPTNSPSSIATSSVVLLTGNSSIPSIYQSIQQILEQCYMTFILDTIPSTTPQTQSTLFQQYLHQFYLDYVSFFKQYQMFQKQTGPMLEQFATFWSLFISLYSKRSMINYIPFITLFVNNATFLLQPGSTLGVNMTSNHQSSNNSSLGNNFIQSAVPYTPNPASNPLNTTPFDSQIAHLNITMSTIELAPNNDPHCFRENITTTHPSSSSPQNPHHYQLTLSILPYKYRYSPLTNAASTPLYTLFEKEIRNEHINHFMQVQREHFKYENTLPSTVPSIMKSIQTSTFGPTSHRKPLHISQPIYREHDYNPKFINSPSMNQYSNERQQYVDMMTSFFISKSVSSHGATSKQNTPKKTQWFELFNNIVDLYTSFEVYASAQSASFLGEMKTQNINRFKYFDWVMLCRPKSI